MFLRGLMGTWGRKPREVEERATQGHYRVHCTELQTTSYTRVCASQRGKLLIKAADDSLVRELWSVVGKLALDKDCSGATKESVNKGS